MDLCLLIVRKEELYTHVRLSLMSDCIQWLKCNGTQGNAVPPLTIYGSKRFPTSDCYNAREMHTTIVTGPNLNIAFPRL